MRVAHPLVSRSHLLLRFDRGKWLAIDNGSPTGMFVNGGRVSVVDIRDGQSINVGSPDGPRLSFLIGRDDRAVGQLPPTVEGMQAIARPAAPRPSGPEHPRQDNGSPPRIARPQPPPRRYTHADPPPAQPQPAGGPRRTVGY
ncbi:FHA domain-containing protein, partial [Mycobacterium senriense]